MTASRQLKFSSFAWIYKPCLRLREIGIKSCKKLGGKTRKKNSPEDIIDVILSPCEILAEPILIFVVVKWFDFLILLYTQIHRRPYKRRLGIYFHKIWLLSVCLLSKYFSIQGWVRYLIPELFALLSALGHPHTHKTQSSIFLWTIKPWRVRIKLNLSKYGCLWSNCKWYTASIGTFQDTPDQMILIWSQKKWEI